MGLPCLKPLPFLLCPRVPQASDLWRLMDGYFVTFKQVYSERFRAKYGLVIERSVIAFLSCFLSGSPDARRVVALASPYPRPGYLWCVYARECFS